jgi:hypothetical protein
MEELNIACFNIKMCVHDASVKCTALWYDWNVLIHRRQTLITCKQAATHITTTTATTRQLPSANGFLIVGQAAGAPDTQLFNPVVAPYATCPLKLDLITLSGCSAVKSSNTLHLLHGGRIKSGVDLQNAHATMDYGTVVDATAFACHNGGIQ